MSRIRSGGVLLPRLLGYCLILCLVGHVGAHSGVSGAETGGVYSYAVVIDAATPIAATDEDFICATLDWWPPEKCDYGTCSWGLASLLNLNLSSPILLNAIKAFSPLKLRLGGSLQDKVIYQTLDPEQPCTPFAYNASDMFSFTEGCLPLARWDELNEFFKKAGAIIIFGLNALNGRVRESDGSSRGPWNYTNAASLIRYTVDKGYTIHGWELGNELSGKGVGTKVDADQYSADVDNLKRIVDDTYQDVPDQKPLVLAPGGFFDAAWFAELVEKTQPNSLDVLTHHIYNLGPGVDEHLVEKILDPTYLDGEASVFKGLQELIRSSGTKATGWVGESGGAYNSGHHLVTDSFVFSFWFLDQLGMSATYDTKTYCRQSLVGGNYGLLNTTTFHPNPDYYSALLWNRLMGTRVLSTNLIGRQPSLIRAYAHCAKESKGITLLLINLSGNTTAELPIISPTDYSSLLGRKYHPGAARSEKDIREEYHLTAKDGDLHSQTMLLNGNALELDADGNIPALDPIRVEASKPITLAPFSIIFAHIPSFQPLACK